SVFALADVAPDALIAAENALLVEDRRAADDDILPAIAADHAGVLEVPERLARGEHRLVLRPAGGQRRDAQELPAFLADHPFQRVLVVGDLVRDVGEAQLLVLPPVPVRGELGQGAETRFAVAQLLLRALALGDVRYDADRLDDFAIRVEHRM